MLTYEQTKKIAIGNTHPNGKVYYSGDAGSFYIFIIVDKDVPDIKGLMTGTTYIAVNKVDGKIFTIDVTDSRLSNVMKIVDHGI